MTNLFPTWRHAGRTLAVAAMTAAALAIAAGRAYAEPNKQVYEKAQQYKNAALMLLARLVNIDSGTGDEQGVKAVGAIAIDELTKLGARIETFPAKPVIGDNIVVTFTGTGKGRIFLIAHMDTVFAKGTAAARPFQIKDDRAYGPGVKDDKGGIVAAVYALKILQDINFRNYAKITLLLNTNEETGSVGTRMLIEKLAKEHDVALNLEGGRPADGLVIWHKGAGVVKVEVKGRSVHAGVAPDSGRNAAMELAYQILQLSNLANRDKGTTLNFTVLKAGDRTNVIPDYAVAEGDVRVTVPEEFDRVEKQLSIMAQKKLIPDTEVTTSLRRLIPPMPQTAQTDVLSTMAQSIYGELSKKLTMEGVGGAADASFAAGVSTPTLDGLGIVGDNAHTDREYVEVESIVPRFYLLTRMLMELGPGK